MALVVMDAADLAELVREAVRAELAATREPEAEWMDEKDAAKLLKCHPRTVRGLGIPSALVGTRKRRYKRADLTAYLEGRRA